jgi:hypothetical protein
MTFLRLYLGEVVAQQRSDLTAPEQIALVDELFRFIGLYSPPRPRDLRAYAASAASAASLPANE